MYKTFRLLLELLSRTACFLPTFWDSGSMPFISLGSNSISSIGATNRRTWSGNRDIQQSLTMTAVVVDYWAWQKFCGLVTKSDTIFCKGKFSLIMSPPNILRRVYRKRVGNWTVCAWLPHLKWAMGSSCWGRVNMRLGTPRKCYSYTVGTSASEFPGVIMTVNSRC